jgi:hypothetical protein
VGFDFAVAEAEQLIVADAEVRGDMGEIWARYGRDTGAIWARYGGVMGEIWAWYGRDTGEIRARYG